MRRWSGALRMGEVRASLHSAREVLPHYGQHVTTTGDAVRLLERWNVETRLEELPDKYAAALSPLLFGRFRFLSLARHVPSAARRLVQLHEAGHLYQHTAELGITYDNDDWRSPAEQGADAFAAVGLLPSWAVQAAKETTAVDAERIDLIAHQLMEHAEGLWDWERARFVAFNRLRVWREIGI